MPGGGAMIIARAMHSRRHRRLAGCLAVAGAAATVALLGGGLRTGGPLRPATAAAATPCLPIICPASPSSHPPSATVTPRPGPPGPSSPGGTGAPSAVPSTSIPSFTVPDPTPTAPPSTPSGRPPQPPSLGVSDVTLTSAGGATTLGPGASVVVQATLTAKRGADVYAVPHAKVTFTVTGPPGTVPTVTPADTDSGDTGVAMATVSVGDGGGERLVTAVSGGSSAQLKLLVQARAAPTPTPALIAGSVRDVEGGGTSGDRATAIGVLVAVGPGLVAATVMRGVIVPWVWMRRRRAALEGASILTEYGRRRRASRR